MKPFDYIPAGSISEACELLRRYGKSARVIAGGTDLLIELRRQARSGPDAVVDISGIGELHGINEQGGGFELLPLTTHSEVLRSPSLNKAARMLSQAAAGIGSPQIRNRGTIGGNIMNAAACADTVPPLIALGATATLRSVSGKREIPLHELFVKPYETRAAEDELLASIRFPRPAPSFRGSFLKLGRRNALSISRLSVAAMLDVQADGRIREARIVPGAAFPTWMRVMDAEAMLKGEHPSRKLFESAGRKTADVMITYTGRRWSTEYKETVLAVMVQRALEACVENR